eukprot:5829518-Lingulodinium_polyedra.AAC.1
MGVVGATRAGTSWPWRRRGTARLQSTRPGRWCTCFTTVRAVGREHEVVIVFDPVGLVIVVTRDSHMSGWGR